MHKSCPHCLWIAPYIQICRHNYLNLLLTFAKQFFGTNTNMLHNAGQTQFFRIYVHTHLKTYYYLLCKYFNIPFWFLSKLRKTDQKYAWQGFNIQLLTNTAMRKRFNQNILHLFYNLHLQSMHFQTGL